MREVVKLESDINIEQGILKSHKVTSRGQWEWGGSRKARK